MKGCLYMKLTLETNRLTLRPFKIEDAEDIFKMWANDDEVTKYLTWNSHKSVDDTKYILNLWIEQYEKVERLNFAIVLKEENLFLRQLPSSWKDKFLKIISFIKDKLFRKEKYMDVAEDLYSKEMVSSSVLREVISPSFTSDEKICGT